MKKIKVVVDKGNLMNMLYAYRLYVPCEHCRAGNKNTCPDGSKCFDIIQSYLKLEEKK